MAIVRDLFSDKSERSSPVWDRAWAQAGSPVLRTIAACCTRTILASPHRLALAGLGRRPCAGRARVCDVLLETLAESAIVPDTVQTGPLDLVGRITTQQGLWMR